ncbi:hypothetical protein EDC18_104207 [Natranaerovirga pectinivora]|uniref:Uncharacterized protein n=1 Tax=Natranaerovirga pectinivora TaxID=682400 RepID=A0A4R3MKH3_9FIRM|nr:hypothetical protein [Natranaerovirga pectinivora]TCT15057.1 hypothetical protein EDC18_104207 [Natranaerovirga pectinivora]
MNLDNVYYNESYNVMLRYPKNWIETSENRFVGEDGFVQVSLIRSDNNLHEVAISDAFHTLEPYGKNPQVIPIKIDNHNARLILPQKHKKNNGEKLYQGSVIIKYEEPVEKNNILYNYLIIWIDVNHIFSIINTIRIL